MISEDFLVQYGIVLGAAFIYFIIGWIWYSPWLFGSLIPSEKSENRSFWVLTRCYILDLIMCFFTALFLDLFLYLLGIDDYLSAFVFTGIVWLGFIVTTHAPAVIWGTNTFKLFAISMGKVLVGLVVMAAIFMTVA